eukprot:scaffold72777_cov43-Cyclotella_meneghiniana.AAC.2
MLSGRERKCKRKRKPWRWSLRDEAGFVDNHVSARRRWIDRGSDGDEVEAAAEEEEVIITGVKRFGSGALDRAPRYSICLRWPIAVCTGLGWLGTSGHVFGGGGGWLMVAM